MFIKIKISQHRRDFQAVFRCEWCGHEYVNNGYDDNRFHKHVVPGLKCPECGEVAPQPLTPVYPEGETI